MSIRDSCFLCPEALCPVLIDRAAQQWSVKRLKWRQPRVQWRAKPGGWPTRPSGCAGGHRSWKTRSPNSTASSMRPSYRRAGWGTESADWRWGVKENEDGTRSLLYYIAGIWESYMLTSQREKKQLEESLAEIKEQEEEVSRANRALTLRLEDVQVRHATQSHTACKYVGFDTFNAWFFYRGTWQNWVVNTRSWRSGYKKRKVRRSSSRTWRTT